MTSSSTVAESILPLTETERAIAMLWKDALQMSEIPTAMDNFFSLGGDSIAMVMVELQIGEEFSVKLPPGAMLVASSLRELSVVVEKCMGSAPRGGGEPGQT